MFPGVEISNMTRSTCKKWQVVVFGVLGVLIVIAVPLAILLARKNADEAALVKEPLVVMDAIFNEPTNSKETEMGNCHPHEEVIPVTRFLNGSNTNFAIYHPPVVGVAKCYPNHCFIDARTVGCCRPSVTKNRTISIRAYTREPYSKVTLDLLVEVHLSCQCEKLASDQKVRMKENKYSKTQLETEPLENSTSSSF